MRGWLSCTSGEWRRGACWSRAQVPTFLSMLDADLSSVPAPRPALDHPTVAGSVDDPRIDGVTGLLGRGALIQFLRAGTTIPPAGGRLVVIVVGLDRFRMLNEVLGDAAGDEVLGIMAARLAAWSVDGRIVGRIGADEFALIGPTDSDYQAAAMAEAVASLVREPFMLSGADHTFHLTACLGVATTMPHGPSESGALRTFRAATEALHDAKQRGPGSIEWFDEHRHHERAEQFRLVNDLHGAVARGELSLAYQPIVEMGTVRPVAVEALMRWNHPELGTLMPGRFIPLMEAAGLMSSAGEWVLRAACDQLVEWGRRLQVAQLPAVCVNVSAVQFDEPEFAEMVGRTLRITGVDADHLILELTEGTLLRDPLRAQAILNELERMGVRVAIDDFGTGHSSLAYLKRLPAQFVKIDRAFVTNVDVDRRDQALVRAVLEVTRALGMTAIAEGVETRDQLIELRRIGYELAQGFYWSTPVSAAAIEPWISGRMLSLAPRSELAGVRGGGPGPGSDPFAS